MRTGKQPRYTLVYHTNPKQDDETCYWGEVGIWDHGAMKWLEHNVIPAITEKRLYFKMAATLLELYTEYGPSGMIPIISPDAYKRRMLSSIHKMGGEILSCWE